MIAIFKRELKSYYHGMLGYLFAALTLIFAGIYTMAYNLSGYYANFEYVLSGITFIYLFSVPVLTMRSVAEEKRQKTDQLLYSLPMRLSDVIIGKYFAMLVVLAVPCCIMALYPLVLSQFGAVSFATAYSGLFAFFLLGACLLSMGLFISSVTESQVAAAVLTLVATLLMYYMTDLASYVSNSSRASLIAVSILVVIFSGILYLLAKNPIVSILVACGGVGGLYVWYTNDTVPFIGMFRDIMKQLSVFDRFYPFVEGVFDLTAVVYYISVICIFLFLAVQSMEKRRWSE